MLPNVATQFPRPRRLVRHSLGEGGSPATACPELVYPELVEGLALSLPNRSKGARWAGRSSDTSRWVGRSIRNRQSTSFCTLKKSPRMSKIRPATAVADAWRGTNSTDRNDPRPIQIRKIRAIRVIRGALLLGPLRLVFFGREKIFAAGGCSNARNSASPYIIRC